MPKAYVVPAQQVTPQELIDYVAARLGLAHDRADHHYEHQQPEHRRQEPARNPIHAISVRAGWR